MFILLFWWFDSGIHSCNQQLFVWESFHPSYCSFCAKLNCYWIPLLSLQRKSWKNLFSYLGPGFLVSIAYIDPGNCKISIFHPSILREIYHSCVLWFFLFSQLCLNFSWNWFAGRSPIQVWGVQVSFLCSFVLIKELCRCDRSKLSYFCFSAEFWNVSVSW